MRRANISCTTHAGTAALLQALNDSLATADGAVVVRPPVRPWVDAAWLSAAEAAGSDAPATADERRSSASSGAESSLVDLDALWPVGGEAAASCWLAPRMHVQEVTRALNFHVLALLRPESLLLAVTALPPAYKEEYVVRQVSRVRDVRPAHRPSQPRRFTRPRSTSRPSLSSIPSSP